MCGITGIIASQSNSELYIDAIQKMTDANQLLSLARASYGF